MYQALLLQLLICWNFEFIAGAKGGKAATKVGLGAIASTQVGAANQQVTGPSSSSKAGEGSYNENRINATLYDLKYDLLILQGYDKAIRPVLDPKDKVLVDIDFTYIQNLNLNEKDQIIKSLIRYRLFWVDAFLVWEPEKYGGLTSIRLPASSIWLPDVVVYEEIGVRDYSPRIPYVEVSYDGTVRYLEPTAFETSCGVDIVFFPFDIQECRLTFASWTFSTAEVDVRSKRSQLQLNLDIPLYFVATGEWVLAEIMIKKISQNYATVLGDSLTYEANDAHIQFYELEPQDIVADVIPSRVTPNHWSDVRYTFRFKRNSSLYMQSMLFPAILLTTISLLGFYLPPDSGERIGLQITIMLTFMVFLLTVGDMFPASTGPYLGLYFVLCMALLGINIGMTVIVLHLHHMPCATIMKRSNIQGEYCIDTKKIPYWVRWCMYLSGLYGDIKTYRVTEEGEVLKGVSKDEAPRLWHDVWRRWSNVVKISKDEEARTNEGGYGDVVPDVVTITGNHEDYISVDRSILRKRSEKENRRNSEPGSPTSVNSTKQNDNLKGRESGQLKELFSDLEKVGKDLTSINGFLRFHDKELKDAKRSGAMVEKWKEIARLVDKMCLRAYIGLLLFYHVAILIAIGVQNATEKKNRVY